MRIKILGNGAWGSALGRLFTANGHEVNFWNKKDQITPLDIVIIALPVQEIRNVFKNYGHNLRKTVIVNCSKGIEKKSHQLPMQIVKEILGTEIEYFALVGPSFAKEVDHKMPTLVNLGGKNGRTQEICNLLETDYFRVRPTKSIEALELAGAFKNVYAIACGIADGLGFEINTKAKLITIAHEEFLNLAKTLDYEIDDQAGPGILGDLVLTCNSEESRNYTFGRNLVEYSVKDSIEKINSTIEGYSTAFSILNFSKKSALPLGEFVLKVIGEDNPRTVCSKFADFVKKL